MQLTLLKSQQLPLMQVKQPSIAEAFTDPQRVEMHTCCAVYPFCDYQGIDGETTVEAIADAAGCARSYGAFYAADEIWRQYHRRLVPTDPEDDNYNCRCAYHDPDTAEDTIEDLSQSARTADKHGYYARAKELWREYYKGSAQFKPRGD